MSTARTPIFVAVALGLASCEKQQDKPDIGSGGGQGAEAKQTRLVRDFSRESVDFDALTEQAKAIQPNDEAGESLRLLIGKLKESLQESGEYSGVIRVLMELPSGPRHQALFELRGVASPLRAEDELAGRLLLVTQVTGIEARTNGLLPEFFSGSSRIFLPELRLAGIKDPANLPILDNLYLDLARTKPDAVLTELQQDAALWNVAPATERVVDYLLLSDPNAASLKITELETSPVKDSAIVSLCRWMKANGESDGIKGWINLVGNPDLKATLAETYP